MIILSAALVLYLLTIPLPVKRQYGPCAVTVCYNAVAGGR